MAGIRIDRGAIHKTQPRMASASYTPAAPPPPRAPPPTRWQPWMTWACIAGGLVAVLIVVGVVIVVSAAARSVPQPAPANLPAWAVTSNAAPAAPASALPVSTIPAPSAPAAPVAAGTAVAAREPNKWQSGRCDLNANFVVNADFDAMSGALPAGWETVGVASPALGLQAVNSPFAAFFANNGRSARFLATKGSANENPAFRLRLGNKIRNDAGSRELVLFAWDMRVAEGTDTWTIEDRADRKIQAFQLKVDKGSVVLDNSQYTFAKIEPNVWYHVELYVNYENANTCVEGVLYNTASNKPVRTWLKLAPASMEERKEAPSGCEELVVRGNVVDGDRAVWIDNLYVGFVHQRR